MALREGTKEKVVDVRYFLKKAGLDAKDLVLGDGEVTRTCMNPECMKRSKRNMQIQPF